jgi:maleylpyruvate isomerase
MTIRLYSYFRSSASYRVRIALQLKGQTYETIPVHLVNHGGEQFAPAFSLLNPQSLVPVMEVDEHHLTQSLAMLEYLEERFPEPPLLPAGLVERAYVREIALAIACDIHPLNNLRVLRMLTQELGLGDEVKQGWITHWIERGLAALEKKLAASDRRGRFCHGDTPTMADCCLVPQIFNARRFEVDMTPYPTLVAIEQACLALPAFQQAAPGVQPDAV